MSSRKGLIERDIKKERVSSDDITRSKVNIFITNIPASELSMEQAYALYKIRWQIELLFKIWKTFPMVFLFSIILIDRE